MSLVQLKSQKYNNTIGMRSGYNESFSYKHFIDFEHTWEGLFSYRWMGPNAGGLYTRYFPVHTLYSDYSNFFLFTGVGAHIGVGKIPDRLSWFINPFWPETDYDGVYSPYFGLDASVGIEYRFSNIPISLAIDAKPFVEFSLFRKAYTNPFDIGFRFSYTLD